MKLGGIDIADFAIVRTEESESARTASKELQFYLKKTAGAALEIEQNHRPAIRIGANIPEAREEIGDFLRRKLGT